MTKIQLKFYNLITKQIVDFDVIFHKDFIIQRLEKIQDEKLKYLLENINIDKDKITYKKGFLTYAKFVYYADKILKKELENAMLPNHSKVDNLYNKRKLLLYTIEKETKNITERNQLIQNLEDKKIMFKEYGLNILDELDYYIINKFGFYNFFDENRNYMIKEQIDIFYKQYTKEKLLVTKTSPTLKITS
ncbi:hypothetical protein N9818_00295 [Arcobacteraceae bacterium]|nr:hypothetical protein [Arcobacteraceae bacterium]